MELRTLGELGPAVSLVGLGCNNFGGRIDLEASRRVVHRALDLGITLFDTADVYGDRGGSETCLGQILGPRRKDIVLATKFGMAMDDDKEKRRTTRAYILGAVEASLKRLKTDWIDLYQVHRPDPRTPIEETLRALDDLVRQGKVRHIGCSNFAAWQLVDAQWTARRHMLTGFASCQDEYSLLERGIERELLPAMRHLGLGLLPYFPLASGMLTGKYRRGEAMPEDSRLAHWRNLGERYLTESNWTKVEALRAFCETRGRSLTELAFSWLASRPCVASIIAGATRPEQVEQNAAAVGWKLSMEEGAEIDRITA